MTTRHSLLNTKRQKSLADLAKACRHHRNVAAARQAAERDTLKLLQAEVQARRQAEAKARRSAPREDGGLFGAADLFQGRH